MKNDIMEITMKEVFLALKPEEGDRLCGGSLGTCAARFICDAGLISQYMQAGWSVYRANGFQRIVEVAVELKMEKIDECCEAPESNNECGR
jgi:hypothetical protein